jgi:hypothetical protein
MTRSPDSTHPVHTRRTITKLQEELHERMNTAGAAR